MIVWLASYPRSGNTLLRMILNQCFGLATYSIYDDRRDIGADPLLAERVGHRFHGLAQKDFIADARRSTDIRFVKTHALPDDDSKAIYIIRDGRAAAVSFDHYVHDFSHHKLTLQEIVTGDVWVGGWSAHVEAWALSGRRDTLVLFFGDLVAGKPECLAKISSFTGMPLLSSTVPEFSQLRSVSPKFFRSGSNVANAAELGSVCPALFWALHGEVMQRLGFVQSIPIYSASQAAEELDCRSFHVFSNGIRLRRRDLLEVQAERYAGEGNPNLHEPIEEDWLLRLFAENMPDHPLFLDIGSGVGYYSALVRKRWPNADIVAVEALPRHAEALKVNLVCNGIAPSTVKVLQVAVAESDGIGEFADQNFGSRLGSTGASASTIRVTTRSLESLISEYRKVHLMKMDIQGSEVEVFSSAASVLAEGRIRHIVVGTHGEKLHREVIQILTNAGYIVVFEDPAPAMQPDGLVCASLQSH